MRPGSVQPETAVQLNEPQEGERAGAHSGTASLASGIDHTLLAGLLLIAVIGQLLFTLNAFNQIRPEELSENVRNVYWFANGLVFSGINAHLGWYASLSWIYTLFGFSFEHGQIFRVVLHAASLVCLVLLFKSFFSIKQSLIPLIAIAFSPTLLYFNVLKVQYGVDLQIVPILLYLIHKINFHTTLGIIPIVLLGSLTMFAWLSYPAVICYLPGLALLYAYRLYRARLTPRELGISSLIALASFVLPAVLLVAQVQNKELLVYDPITTGGLFRGAGSFDVRSWEQVAQRMWATAQGFTGETRSYYYEVTKAEFSNVLPVASAITGLTVSSAYFIAKPGYRVVVLATWIVLLINLATIAFLNDPAGPSSVRRATPALLSLFALYSLAWLVVFQVSEWQKLQRLVLAGVLALLPLHHVVVYPTNLAHVGDPSNFRYGQWLVGAETPSLALARYVTEIQKDDLKLPATWTTNREFGTTYNWIFSSISAACHWNHLQCHRMVAVDPARGIEIPLTLENVNYVSKENWSS